MDNKKVISVIFILFLCIQRVYAYNANTCKSLYDDQKFTQASRCYYNIVQTNNNDIQSRFYYAASLFYSRQYSLAYNQYKYIADKYPNSNIGRYSRSEAEKVRQKMIAVQKAKSNDTGNYLTSLDKATKWYKMPIKVWIQPSAYRNYSINAFYEWQRKTQNMVSFQFVTNEKQGQIKVYFVDKVNGSVSEENIGLTTLKYIGDMNTSATIQILQRTDSNKMRSYAQIYPVVLHEIGHALGMHGHSSSSNDILYPNNYTNDVHLSNRDANTIKEIYKKKSFFQF